MSREISGFVRQAVWVFTVEWRDFGRAVRRLSSTWVRDPTRATIATLLS